MPTVPTGQKDTIPIGLSTSFEIIIGLNKLRKPYADAIRRVVSKDPKKSGAPSAAWYYGFVVIHFNKNLYRMFGALLVCPIKDLSDILCADDNI